jgi:hypothetical protein
MGRLGERAQLKVSGPTWEGKLRTKFMTLCDTLLGVSPESFAELTTIYIKFSLSDQSSSPVYAVVWIKNSKKWLVGLALPKGVSHPNLIDAPPQRTYTGLTSYFYLSEDEELPVELPDWSNLAFENIRANSCQ